MSHPDPAAVKLDSERRIRAAGGPVCDRLPALERAEPRAPEEVVARALILNALLNIAFEAPIPIIAGWIQQHDLESHLSATERELLSKANDQLTERDQIQLSWLIETLWSFMWAGSLIERMPFDEPVADHMASLCPNLEQGEGPGKFTEKMILRPANQLFAELDLYYRLHWWTRDASLNGYDTGRVKLSAVMERRKALEWILDPSCDWDHVPDNT